MKSVLETSWLPEGLTGGVKKENGERVTENDWSALTGNKEDDESKNMKQHVDHLQHQTLIALLIATVSSQAPEHTEQMRFNETGCRPTKEEGKTRRIGLGFAPLCFLLILRIFLAVKS